MMACHYNMDDRMLYNKSWGNKNLTDHFFITYNIHENPNTYGVESNKDDFNSYNIIQKAFINVVFAERVHQIAFERSKDDMEFRTAEEESLRTYSQLKESLTTEEQKNLLSELESAWNKMYGVFLEYSYCQGLADSKMIHKALDKYGILVKEPVKVNYSH